MLGFFKVPEGVDFKAFDQPPFGSHLLRKIGTAIENLPEDSSALCCQGTFYGVSPVLAELVEAQ